MISLPDVPESSGPTVAPLIVKNGFQVQAIIASTRCDCGHRLKFERETFFNAADNHFYLWLKGVCRSCGGRKDLLFFLIKGIDKVGLWACICLSIMVGLLAVGSLFFLPHRKTLDMRIMSYASVIGVAVVCFWMSWKLSWQLTHIKSRRCLLSPPKEVK